MSLHTEENINLSDDSVSVQTITTSSTTALVTLPSSEIQVVHTHVPFRYEVQQLTIDKTASDVTFSFNHNSVTTTMVLNVVDSSKEAIAR